jgi:hypothetical protein
VHTTAGRAVLDPAPLPGIPKVTSVSTMAGLMDIALHPRFAENKWVYISYHKPRGTAPDATGKDFPVASNSILRGHLERDRADRHQGRLRVGRRRHRDVAHRVRPRRHALHDDRRARAPVHPPASIARSTATTTPARSCA